MWALALEECRLAVKILAKLRMRVTMLRDEGIESQSVAESVTSAMEKAGISKTKKAKVKRK